MSAPHAPSPIGWAGYYGITEIMPWHEYFETFDTKEETISKCLKVLHELSKDHAIKGIRFVEREDEDGTGSFGFKAMIV